MALSGGAGTRHFAPDDQPEAVERLRRETRAIPGRPGWRVDEEGREWYSAAWLDEIFNGEEA